MIDDVGLVAQDASPDRVNRCGGDSTVRIKDRHTAGVNRRASSESGDRPPIKEKYSPICRILA